MAPSRWLAQTIAGGNQPAASHRHTFAQGLDALQIAAPAEERMVLSVWEHPWDGNRADRLEDIADTVDLHIGAVRWNSCMVPGEEMQREGYEVLSRVRSEAVMVVAMVS